MIDSTTKEIWCLLVANEQPRTAAEVARAVNLDVKTAFNRLSAMRRRNQVRAFQPSGSRWLRYGVTGECIVPTGVAVAEVVAGVSL